MRTMMLIGTVAVLLAGCGGVPYSDPYASVATSQKADCERTGGKWIASTAVCDTYGPK
jgi:hypothetical protein